MKRLIALATVATWASACGGHIKPYEPKRRVYTPPVETPKPVSEKTTQGSLMGGPALLLSYMSSTFGMYSG